MRWTTVLIVTLSLTMARNAASQEPSSVEATAAAEKQRGDRAMDSLHFDEAIDAYTRAYTLGHDPAVLYNRGRVHQARGDYPKALADLEIFEREAPPQLRAKVPKLAELVADLRAHVATLTLRCNVAGARVLVRGVVVGVTPLDPLSLNAGAARIEVNAADHVPNASNMVLAGGSTTVLDITLVPKQLVGTLVVTASGPAATIFVDGEKAGVTPLEILRPPGNHRIVVRRDAASDLETSAVLTAGERKELHFDAPEGKGILAQWWFWAGAAVLVAGATVAIVVVARSEKSPSDGDGFSPPRVSGPFLRW